MVPYKTFLIAGPTASGKSGLALKLAQQFNGVIINTDSMQVYRDLRLLTARPSIEDESKAAHRLYGHVDAAHVYSTGAWLRSVETSLPLWRKEFETLIFVGGTGLYFNCLTQGLSEIPEVPVELRQKLRQEMANSGVEAIFNQLKAEDPLTAHSLQLGDSQRIVRALEVFRHTGRSLRDWQTIKTVPLIDLVHENTRALVLEPDRELLAARIENRFNKMVEAGALDEVKALVERDLNTNLPLMKAIGVVELRAFLAGESSLQAALDHAVIATRQYAKRQRTWFRGQMGAQWVRFSDSAEAFNVI